VLLKVRDLVYYHDGRLIPDIQAVLAIEPSNETAKEELLELEGLQEKAAQSGNDKVKVRSHSLTRIVKLIAESKRPTTFSTSYPQTRADPCASISNHRGDQR
jgi:hypothetical protein